MAAQTTQNQSQNQNNPSALKEDRQAGPQGQDLQPEKNLFSWRAPGRPFKRRDRDFWVRIMAIAVIFGLILFFAEGVMPVILIISLIFLFYVLSTVEPEPIDYTLTNRSVKIAGQATDYSLINRYWFTRRFDDTLLVFETLNLPGRMEFVINANDQERIRKILSEYLREEEAPPSGLDKAANWFARKLPQA